jgi:3-hydroxyisobutyryl-CoA hydrolase
MPLRAKILSTPAMSASITYDSSQFAAREGDDPEDVLFGSLYGLRTIELNRPKKHNSLNGSMIRKITPRLLEWEMSDLANVVVIKGVGDKAFCAGGDVRDVAVAIDKDGKKGRQFAMEYFAAEYSLDHLIATYKKPYVAFMDGYTMGGGVGLSVHAPLRIATERTVFAMPETTIGFFPDVGASFFLPKMPGAVGTYLALTSERLKGVNVFYSGIATHYIHSTSLPNLESRLAELQFGDRLGLKERLAIINDTIEEFSTGLPHDEPMLVAGELRKAIDRCFDKSSVQQIITALEREEGITKAWAEKTLETLHQRSPTSVHVALKQMQVGKNWSIKETFTHEYQIAVNFMKHPDFVEGVSALLVRRPSTAPSWQPAKLEDIPITQDVAAPLFAPSGVPQMEFLDDRDYERYPYPEFSLPTEQEISRLVRSGAEDGRSRSAVLRHFLARMKARQGIREVVSEVLDRKTQNDQNGILRWLA